MREGTDASRIFRPKGQITSSTVDVIRRKLDDLLDEAGKDLTIDLEEVELMDSVGLSLVIGAHISLSQTGGRLSVINVSEEIFDLFLSMRLDRQFSIAKRGASL